MSSTLGEVSADVQPADSKKSNLRKAFNFLKNHAAAVANFTLQWQDLEDHFLSIHDSIEAKLQQVQANQNQFAPTLQSQAKLQETQSDSTETQLTPTLQSQEKCKETQFTSKETQLVPPIQSQFNSKEIELSPTIKSQAKSKETQFTTLQNQVNTEESLPQNASFNGIPIYDGKELLLYLNENFKEDGLMRNDIYNALKVSLDSGKLVFEAMKWFYLPELNKGDMNIEVSAVRRSCLLLLEELMRVRPVIKADVREEAVKLALEWKEKIRAAVKNSLEVYGFLLLLGAFGLTSEFDGDEVLKLFDSVLQRKQAPELFRALGFADEASDFIQKLISQNKQLDAIRFIYAYELVDKFPPVPLLKDHLKYTKKFAKMSCKGKKSPKAQDEATNKEIAAIRAVIRCIHVYNLGSQYSPENLRNRIKQLKKHREEKAMQLRKHSKERKVTATVLGPKDQVQQQSANKRTSREWKAQSNQENRKKRPRRDAGHASVNEAFSTHLVHQPAGFFVGQGAEFSGTAAGAAAIPNVPVGATSTIPSWKPTHHHPESSFTGQEARYLTPSAGVYRLARSSPDPPLASLSAGRYGLLHSGSVTQHRSLTTGPYGLMGSTPVAQLMNSTAGHYGMVGSKPGTAGMSSFAGQYVTSMGANGSTGRIGSAGFHTGMGIAPNSSPDRSISYYPGHPSRIPNYYDRSGSYRK